MISLGLFVEDDAHVAIVRGLVRRVADERRADVRLVLRSGRRGAGPLLHDLGQYGSQISRQGYRPDDGVLVVLDADCRGYAETRRTITQHLGAADPDPLVAIPDPHIERWLMLDARAFRQAVGRGFAAPRYKCERDRYKRALERGIRDAGMTPVLGGLEHADAIISHMDLQRARWNDPAFGQFLADIRAFLGKRANG